MVLDVEGYSNCRPYNVGFRVADKGGNCYYEHNAALMPCVWENIQQFIVNKENYKMKAANEMTHKNIEEILIDKDDKYIKYYDIDKFFNKFLDAISYFGIKKIWAYNVTFDHSALKRLFTIEQTQIIENIITYCDIIPAITYTYLLNEKYITFCKDNKFFTPKGYISTKAEIVYRYLTGNLNFKEAHTGLEDTRIETEILLTAMGKKSYLKYKPIQAWRVIKNFCIENCIDMENEEKTVKMSYEMQVRHFCKKNGIELEEGE